MDAIIKINMDNAAFQDGEAAQELSRILNDLAERVQVLPDYEAVIIRDINGNRVGQLEFQADGD